MTKKQSTSIVKKATQMGVYAVAHGIDSDRTVNFGRHSEYSFKRYSAAVAFLLAFEIEKER